MAADVEPEWIERRASTRYPCNLSTSCRLIASVQGDAYHGRVRNISAGGISLVLGHCFETGSLISVELRSMARNFSRTLPVSVIYCIEHPSGDYILGGSFVNGLVEDEVKAFLS